MDVIELMRVVEYLGERVENERVKEKLRELWAVVRSEWEEYGSEV